MNLPHSLSYGTVVVGLAFSLVLHYLPSSNLLFCGNHSVMYDETYGVIYEIIARKLGASLEPFWDLKISKYRKLWLLSMLSSRHKLLLTKRMRLIGVAFSEPDLDRLDTLG